MKWIEVAEYAKIRGISKAAVYRLIQRDSIPNKKVSRIEKVQMVGIEDDTKPYKYKREKKKKVE